VRCGAVRTLWSNPAAASEAWFGTAYVAHCILCGCRSRADKVNRRRSERLGMRSGTICTKHLLLLHVAGCMACCPMHVACFMLSVGLFHGIVVRCMLLVAP
jgi:hypothetical protein